MRVALLAAFLAGAAVSGLSSPFTGVPGAHADQVRPRLLALAQSTFPGGAKVKGATAGNAKADAATMLHTVPLEQLGRVGGYLESASWTSGSGHTATANAVTLQYSASIFSSPDEASAAYGDARASLWESGLPQKLPGGAEIAFTVQTGNKRFEVDTAGYRGAIEYELTLRFGSSIRASARLAAVRVLARATTRVAALVLKITGSLPGPAAPAALAPVFVAPWGTGPVVKSPSLMVNASTGVPGAFRPSSAPLAAHALGSPGVAPSGELSRFVQITTDGTGAELYDAAALFPSAAAAAQAYQALAATNDARTAFRAQEAGTYLPNTRWLAAADASREWLGSDETAILVRYQNVLMILLQSGQAPSGLAGVADRLGSTVPSWLHAAGTSIVDAAGARVHLAGLNWYGAEEQDFVVGGLDYRSYQEILTSMVQLGFNSIRLPFSNQLVEQNPVVTAHLAANPQLQGLHALDILDRIIGYAGALGLSVILDDHRSEAGWSAEANGLWYTPAYPDSAFQADWAALAHRYAVNDVVVGADLRNEPHGAASWGDGNQATDWRAAAQRAGDAVLAQNPNLLVIVEGVQYYGSTSGYWWGGNLMGVATAPVALQLPDGTSAQSRLVYSAHDYGTDNCAGGCPWFNQTTTYASLAQVWDQYWGYIAADPSKPYAAPVWVGEFGTCNYQLTCANDTTPGSQGQWFDSMVRYIAERHLNWAYWSANGTQSTAATRSYGALDWYGMFSQDWTQPIPFLQGALQGIQNDPSQTPPESVAAARP